MSTWLPLLLLLAFVAWRVLGVVRARRRVPQWLAEGAQCLDVRTSAEFASGHAPGSVNIPLDELAGRASELDRARPVIVCCATGTRSAMARRLLLGQGFARVLNAGSWRNLP